MDLDLDSFEFSFNKDYLENISLEDLQPLDTFIDECFGTNGIEQSSAAIVSPSSTDIVSVPSSPEESTPDTVQELFNMDFSDFTSMDEVIEVPQQQCIEVSTVEEPQQQYIEVPTVEELPANSIPVASFIFRNGQLLACDPITAVPTEQKPKRGRPPLPKVKTIPGEWYCVKCDKNFMTRRGLLQHVNSHHSGVKAHSCDICGKRFDLLDAMQKHRERHSADKKPFGCGFEGCPKRFVHQADLDRHIKLKHGQAPFSCSICGKGFGRKDHVEKHEVSHKNNTVKKR